ncbi:MAG TPA: permease prefix domain 1-containing protein [bacterium]|nr:permease prefix domain 1-containing protein [bacterium]
MRRIASIDEYLRSLRRWIGSGPRAHRVLEEVQAHLEDARDSLTANGTATEDAERIAAERFGAPRQVALSFYLKTPFILLERMEPFALIGTTLVAIGFSTLMLFFTGMAMLVQDVTAGCFVHLGLGSGSATIALLIWAALAFGMPVLRRLARAGGLFMLAFGLLGVGIATWFGAATGDWEYSMHVLHGNLALMGFLAVRRFSREADSLSASG